MKKQKEEIPQTMAAIEGKGAVDAAQGVGPAEGWWRCQRAAEQQSLLPLAL